MDLEANLFGGYKSDEKTTRVIFNLNERRAVELQIKIIMEIKLN